MCSAPFRAVGDERAHLVWRPGHGTCD